MSEKKIIKVSGGKLPLPVKVKRSTFLSSRRDILIKNATQSEKLFQAKLKERGIEHQFQYIMDGKIIDFYFPKQSKIIELDGKRFHDKEKDSRRDKQFANKNIKTLRIKSHRIFWDLDAVMMEVEVFLFNKKLPKRKEIKSRRKKARNRELKNNKNIIERLASLRKDENYKDFLQKIGDD